MIGLDKKAVRKLEKLDGLESLSARDMELVAGLCEWYRSDETHFWTTGQRKLIDSLYALYVAPLTHKELVQMEIVKGLGEDPVASDWEREFARSLIAQYGHNPRAWSDSQTRKVKDICERLGRRRKQAAVRDRLDAALEADTIPAGARRFCFDIVRAFDTRKQWSDVQMEHAEKILAGNRDPEDGEEGG